MFRQSVRRAMKRVTSNLEGEPASTMASVEAHYVATHISSVIQQIAEVIHKMHLVSIFHSNLAGWHTCISYTRTDLSMINDFLCAVVIESQPADVAT